MTANLPSPSDLQALFSARHSSRAFLPDPLPQAVIKDILSCAQKVPSMLLGRKPCV